MEEDVRGAFFDLATVEEEIRRDIDTYAIDNVKPIEFATRIRKIPGMAITTGTKLRNVRTSTIGYEEEHDQPLKFRRHRRRFRCANGDTGARHDRTDAKTMEARSTRVARGSHESKNTREQK